MESYREEGKVKQRTLEYLGRVVERDGKEVIIPPRKRLMAEPRVKSVLRFGDVRALYELAQELRLAETIDEATVKGGLSPGEVVTIMAINKITDPKSSVKLSAWYEDTSLVDLVGIPPSSINPDSVGGAFDAVCEKTDAGAVEDRFFQIEKVLWERIQELFGVDRSSLVYDITSTYVYGSTLPLAARGYNRDGNYHEQYNVALALSMDRLLPLHFRVLPGNIVDVTTMRMFMVELRAFGIERATLVADRGFYSAGNLVEVAGNGYHVIGAIPARLKLFRSLLARARDIEHNRYACRRGDSVVYLKELDEEVEKDGEVVPIKAVVVLNPEKRERDRRSRVGRILEIEEKLLEVSERLAAGEYVGDLNEVVKNLTGKYDNCFKVTYSKGELKVKRKHKAVERVQNRCGKYVVFSTDLELDAMEILDRYMEKYVVEKAFLFLKQVEELQPTRYRLENRVMAYVFVCVLGYLLYSMFRARLGDDLEMSATEALEELGRVREVVFRAGDDELRQLTELTKKQKEIIRALGMEELYGM